MAAQNKFMGLNRLKLKTAVNTIDDQIADLEDELSYLKAAKKNLEVLIDKPTDLKINEEPKIKKEEEL